MFITENGQGDDDNDEDDDDNDDDEEKKRPAGYNRGYFGILRAGVRHVAPTKAVETGNQVKR
jgi:hypothetical protein